MESKTNGIPSHWGHCSSKIRVLTYTGCSERKNYLQNISMYLTVG